MSSVSSRCDLVRELAAAGRLVADNIGQRTEYGVISGVNHCAGITYVTFEGTEQPVPLQFHDPIVFHEMPHGPAF